MIDQRLRGHRIGERDAHVEASAPAGTFSVSGPSSDFANAPLEMPAPIGTSGTDESSAARLTTPNPAEWPRSTTGFSGRPRSFAVDAGNPHAACRARSPCPSSSCAASWPRTVKFIPGTFSANELDITTRIELVAQLALCRASRAEPRCSRTRRGRARSLHVLVLPLVVGGAALGCRVTLARNVSRSASGHDPRRPPCGPSPKVGPPALSGGEPVVRELEVRRLPVSSRRAFRRAASTTGWRARGPSGRTREVLLALFEHRERARPRDDADRRPPSGASAHSASASPGDGPGLWHLERSTNTGVN